MELLILLLAGYAIYAAFAAPSKEVSIKVNVLIVAQNAMQVLGEQASSLKPNTKCPKCGNVFYRKYSKL